jgi:hypothetical protein
MKLKNFFLLIIKIKYIHEFNVLRLNSWIYSTKKKVSFIGILYHAFTQMSFLPTTLLKTITKGWKLLRTKKY